MKINGNDLILLGLCFGVAGALILAKGYVFQGSKAIEDESATYYGANPFAIRNKVIQRWEGICGWALVLPAALFQLLGVFLNLMDPNAEPVLASSAPNIVFLVLFSIVLMWGTGIMAEAVAKYKWMPQLKAMQKQAMDQTEGVLKNDGLYLNEVGKEIDVKREFRDGRLHQAKTRLCAWERLFRQPRKARETDIEYLQRLKAYLNSY